MQYFARTCQSVLIAAIVLTSSATASSAAELTFFCASALQSTMLELLPRFESASGHHVKAEYGNIGTITERVRKGDPADLVIVSPKQLESLHAEGKVGLDGSATVSHVGIGISIQTGRNKPDIQSVEALKAALRSAGSIAVGDPKIGSPAGVYTLALIDRLGIAEDIRPKLKFIPPGPGNVIANAVAAGADLGIDQISLIVASPAVELVGPLPRELQNFTAFTAAIPVTAKEAVAARSLVQFLTSPEAAAVFRSKGLEPG